LYFSIVIFGSTGTAGALSFNNQSPVFVGSVLAHPNGMKGSQFDA